MEDKTALPLNAVRVFVQIVRSGGVTEASRVLGMTQSAASRHLKVLEGYLGQSLLERHGPKSHITEFGRLFAETVTEPLDTILFTGKRMRRQGITGENRLIVRTSLSTFTYSVLMPNLHDFQNKYNSVVDVTSSLSPPHPTDKFDVLLTRDLNLSEPSDCWDIYDEHIVCVGAPKLVENKDINAVRSIPVISVTSRPDILPTWLRFMNINISDICTGASYDHHYIALPAVTCGQCLLVAPHIIIADLIRDGLLEILPNSRARSGASYKACSVDRSNNPLLSREFCRWINRLCKKKSTHDS